MKITDLLKEQAPIVDVRTPQEFNSGHVAGAINIPLGEIPNRMEEIRKLPQPFILCCMSGNRSGQATHFLTQNGLNCMNGGGWMELNYQFAEVNS